MEPKPKPAPAQPNPAETTLPAKGTPDSQSTEAGSPTNLPPPAGSAVPAKAAPPASPAADEPKTDSVGATEALTDPAAADVPPGTHGDTDPGASRNDDAQPL
jgi:hypothetical protein